MVLLVSLDTSAGYALDGVDPEDTQALPLVSSPAAEHKAQPWAMGLEESVSKGSESTENNKYENSSKWYVERMKMAHDLLMEHEFK